MARDYLHELINIDLWNQANWRGTAFFVEPTGHVPPSIGVVFENGEFGRRIFTGWRSNLGETDDREQLRVAIIEGDIPGEDPGYTVHIGPDPDNILGIVRDQGLQIDESHFLMVSRLHRMNSGPGSPFLPGFKEAYALHQRYSLLPVSMGTSPGDVSPHFELAIAKRKIVFRQVDDIREGDVDSVIFMSSRHDD
jgi:hypothetical protein